MPFLLLPHGRYAPATCLLIATDEIIEVCAKDGSEFGIAAIERLLQSHAKLPLAELAASILETVCAFGKQQDDQTLLLVRHTAGPSPALEQRNLAD